MNAFNNHVNKLKNKGLLRLSPLLMVLLSLVLISGCGDGDGTVYPPPEPEPPSEEFFDPNDFPIDLPRDLALYGYGQVAFSQTILPDEKDGWDVETEELLVVGGFSPDIFKVRRADGSPSSLEVTGNAGELLSIVLDPGDLEISGDEILYVGDDLGRIYSVDRITGAATQIADVGGAVHGLKIAPLPDILQDIIQSLLDEDPAANLNSLYEGYGNFGRQVIAATPRGIIAFDPKTSAVTAITSSIPFSDLEFAMDGTLYAVQGINNAISTVEPDGQVIEIAIARGGLDGVAVDDRGQRLYVADSVNDTLYSVDLLDNKSTDLGYVDFDNSAYPSGLAFDGSNLLMLTGERTMTIEMYTPETP